MLFIAPIHPHLKPLDHARSDIAIRLTLNYSGRRTRFGSPARILTSNNTSALGFCFSGWRLKHDGQGIDTIH